jgi:hypothetical protein
MGGSVNLQGGGQYSMPNIQGYGQNAANIGQSAAGFGSRFGNRYGRGNYGPPPQYDGGYGDYGGQYGDVSTGGKGFQQQPAYQPAPVMQPYVDQVSTGGKGFEGRQTPSQSVAYAPMNIPQMQLAQPSFYYPNIGSQMANLNANYGMGGLGAMGGFGNYPMMPRQPAPMQMYPALAPPPPPPQTSTGGKGFRTGPVKPSRPGMFPPDGGQPQPPGYPPVGTGGKGFQPTPPTQPPPPEPDYRDYVEPAYPDYGGKYGQPDYSRPEQDDVLRPVRPEDYMRGDIPSPGGIAYPQYGVSEQYGVGPQRPFEFDNNPIVSPAQEVQPTNVESTMPTYEDESVDPFMGLNQRDLID